MVIYIRYITYTKIFLQFTKKLSTIKKNQWKQGLFNKMKADVWMSKVCKPPILYSTILTMFAYFLGLTSIHLQFLLKGFFIIYNTYLPFIFF